MNKKIISISLFLLLALMLAPLASAVLTDVFNETGIYDETGTVNVLNALTTPIPENATFTYEMLLGVTGLDVYGSTNCSTGVMTGTGSESPYVNVYSDCVQLNLIDTLGATILDTTNEITYAFTGNENVTTVFDFDLMTITIFVDNVNINQTVIASTFGEGFDVGYIQGNSNAGDTCALLIRADVTVTTTATSAGTTTVTSTTNSLITSPISPSLMFVVILLVAIASAVAGLVFLSMQSIFCIACFVISALAWLFLGIYTPIAFPPMPWLGFLFFAVAGIVVAFCFYLGFKSWSNSKLSDWETE
jgi:hypothetical protein